MPAKKVVQDIVPSERRSIRNIPIERPYKTVESSGRESSTRSRMGKVIPIRTEDRTEESKEPPVKKTNRKPSKKPLISFIIILLCMGVIGLAASLLYSKAVVTITPKTVPVNVDGTFTAKKSPVGVNELGYEVISNSQEVSKSIPASSSSLVETKAKGTMRVYNDYGPNPQTLVAGTRFATTDGLIYRTTNSIVVPGKKTSPGSVDVVVLADQAGANYNRSLSSSSAKNEVFQVVAYKGGDKYGKFYGQLKTDLSGGFSGNKMVVDAVIQESTVNALKADLNIKLLSAVKKIVPAGYVLYDSATSVEYEITEPVVPTNTKTAEIKVKGTVYGLIFKNDDLLRSMAGKEIQRFPSSTYNIKGIESLSFQISNIKDFSIKKATPVIFNLKGMITIVGTFSEEKLKQDLKGITLKESNTVFANYTSIGNAHTLLTPFWMRSFPKSENNIIIKY